MGKPAAALRCSNGANCVAHPILGEPAKLSRSNPGPRCFACEERRADAELEAAAAKEEAHRKATGAREVNRSRRSGGNKPRERICMKASCKRTVVERDGIAVVCREHAEERRAATVREHRIAWVLACERAVRSAIASADERLERRWVKLLLAAEASLAEAEADLRVAEIRARPATETQRPKRSTKSG
jgi:hypothetical protein